MKNDTQKQDTAKILLDELTAAPPEHVSGWKRVGRILLVPALAVFTGLVLGAFIIIATSEEVYAAFGQSFGAGLSTAWNSVAVSYSAMFTGSLGDPARIITALQGGDAIEIRRAVNPILESLVVATPYIFAGLAVALGFRAGLFNIGVEGQLFIGAAAATEVGYAVTGLPAYIHIPLAYLAGAV